MTIVLIGPPAAGKTRTGRRLARRLGLTFTDTDREIERGHGPIPGIFAERGEAGFRELEREAVAAALAGGGVVALGGGAITDPLTRQRLAEHTVLLVTARPEAIAPRIEGSGKRPLLRSMDDWLALYERRREHYEHLARARFDTSFRPMSQVVEEMAAWLERAGEDGNVEEQRVDERRSDEEHVGERRADEDGGAGEGIARIGVAGGHGDVLIGSGLIRRLPELLPGLLGDRVEQLLIVHPPSLARIAEEVRDSLAEGYGRVLMAEIPDAESAKRIEVAAFVWKILGQADFTRSDAILTIGGGATSDIGGFIAAGWLRGIPVVHVPTTVLAMADAAIGGKTGINTEEGKNLVGAFHAPAGVVVDFDVLAELPRNELLAGLAEVVKCGFIAEPEILELIEAEPRAATDPDSPVFRRIVELAVRVKARVVGEDPREAGRREILNYGHTLGHAIEHAERYQWRHGAAISIGMVFAAELARLSGRLSDEEADRHRRVLELLGLPVSYPAGRWPTLLATMRRDKKARGSMLRFIVLDGAGRPTVMNAPEESLLFAAYQETASR